jgi:hypothetical protein
MRAALGLAADQKEYRQNQHDGEKNIADDAIEGHSLDRECWRTGGLSRMPRLPLKSGIFSLAE